MKYSTILGSNGISLEFTRLKNSTTLGSNGIRLKFARLKYSTTLRSNGISLVVFRRYYYFLHRWVYPLSAFTTIADNGFANGAIRILPTTDSTFTGVAREQKLSSASTVSEGKGVESVPEIVIPGLLSGSDDFLNSLLFSSFVKFGVFGGPVEIDEGGSKF